MAAAAGVGTAWEERLRGVNWGGEWEERGGGARDRKGYINIPYSFCAVGAKKILE